MLNLEIPDEIYRKAESHHGRRRMRRLPSVLREEEQIKHDYDPKVVSFGPYHHGKSELYLGESFKHKALEIFVSGSGKDKCFFYNNIVEDIDEIRGCYDGVSTDEYDDEALAEMMLLDGCFLINHMEVLSNSEKLVNVLYALGMVGFSFTVRDMFLLENQVPFRVISLLISLRYDTEKGEDLLNRFLNFSAFQGRSRQNHHSRDDEGQPLHLLEAIRRTLASESCTKSNKQQSHFSLFQCFFFPWRKNREPEHGFYVGKIKEEANLNTLVYTSRSVTDLKAKGIHFKPSPTSCLKDVKFKSCGIFYGQLQLPVRFISDKTKVLFSNLIAYEICPNNVSDYTVSSYVNLMKSLIHCPKDVKELREKRILISNLGSDEQVLKVFKEMNTYGMENAGIFQDVKEKIEEHYNSKAKTWMAELIHTYFESPWTAIALFAAIFLLCLTFIQTYFTIHPSHV
ncbi:hypothetical protein Pfo_027661 [Paulownia fortunei]|nr:hypothetical protein Pfo_027661 [Paulownia fortunei]